MPRQSRSTSHLAAPTLSLFSCCSCLALFILFRPTILTCPFLPYYLAALASPRPSRPTILKCRSRQQISQHTSCPACLASPILRRASRPVWPHLSHPTALLFLYIPNTAGAYLPLDNARRRYGLSCTVHLVSPNHLNPPISPLLPCCIGRSSPFSPHQLAVSLSTSRGANLAAQISPRLPRFSYLAQHICGKDARSRQLVSLLTYSFPI